MPSANQVFAILTNAAHRGAAGRLPHAEIVAALRRGLPSSANIHVIRYFGLNEKHLLNLLGISKNTLRRAIRSRRRLTPAQSDRLYRLVRVGLIAEEVLVNREGAHAWLVRPRRALGGVSPIDLLDTDAGTQAVEILLARIERGIVT